MSLDSLLSEDLMTVQTLTPGQDASSGPTETPTTKYPNVPCRFERLGASQLPIFSQLAELVTHRGFTQQTGIANGDICVLSDGTVVRVTGIQFQKGIGGMDDFYELEGVELKQ